MNMYKLYTDGSCLNRFALGGIGGYILNDENQEVVAFSEVIYTQIKNHETQALLCGLKIARQMGITQIECYSDSKSIEDVFSAKHKKRQNYYSKHNDSLKEAFELSKEFQHFKCIYIPREENKKADKLSHIALVKKRESSILVKHQRALKKNKQPYEHLGLKTLTEFNHVELSKLTQTIKSHFIFEKKKTEDLIQVHAYLVSFSTDKDYTVEKLNTFNYTEGYKDSNAFMIDCVNHVFKDHNHLKNTTLTISGTLVQNILASHLKGYKKQLTELAETIHQYENVCLYTRPLVKELIANNMKRPDIKDMIDITQKENLIHALEIVTQKDYKIENNDIYTISANYYTQNQFESVEKVEKYYFHQLVRLNINEMKKNNIKPNKEELLENLKEELKNRNIKLNF